MISDHVVFSSSGFPVQPGEDAETNPGIYGRALAEWVATRLDSHGVPVLGIRAEDFGRCVVIQSWPFKLWVACASLDGNASRWQMFIALEQNRIWKLFTRVDPEPELRQLREQFRTVISEIPDAKDIEWQAH
jgi:hypothetical protein